MWFDNVGFFLPKVLFMEELKMARKRASATGSRARSKKMLIQMTGVGDPGRKHRCLCDIGEIGDPGRKRRRRHSMRGVGAMGRSQSGCLSPVYNRKTGVTMCKRRVGKRLVFSHKMR